MNKTRHSVSFLTFQITIGRGVDVTYQLLSPSCPLMISRLHCTFKQREDGQWMVTDKRVDLVFSYEGKTWASVQNCQY